MSSIIKVNTIQDAGGNALLTSNGSGTLTTNNIGGTNTPIFSAYSNANQTGLSQAAYTKITLNAEYFDSNSAFDVSSYRFTVPSGEAGKYLIFARYGAKSTSEQANAIYGRIYKNGSASTEGGFQKVENGYYISANQDQINTGYGFFDASVGDYFELYLSMDVQNTGTWVALGSWCSMTGYKLIT